MKRVRTFVVGLLFFTLNIAGQFTSSKSNSNVTAQKFVPKKVLTVSIDQECLQHP